MLQTIANGFEMAAVQKRIWLLQQRYRRSFTAGVCLQVKGAVDKELLFSSLCSITDRHGIFRAEFKFIDTTLAYPFQVEAGTNLYPSFEYIDLSGKNREEQEQIIRCTWNTQFEGTASQTGFLNAILVKQDEVLYTLIITAPALSADSHSLMNVTEELFQLYTGSLNDKDSENSVLQFTQFSEWHNNILSQEDAEARRFWESRTKEVANAPLPLEDICETATCRFETAAAELNKIHFAELDTWCNNRDISTENFMLAAWAVLLWQHTGQRDKIVLGITVKGRSLGEFDSINGPFSKTVPFLSVISKESSFEDLCRLVQDEAARVNDWQDNFNWKEDGYNSMSGCALQFEYTEVPQTEFTAGGLSVQYTQIRSTADWYRLKLSCTSYGGNRQAVILAGKSYFSAEALACIKEQFENLVSNILAGRQQTAGSLFTISAWERNRVKEVFNATKWEFNNTRSVSAYIEEQARVNPGQVALKCGSESLTYSEFNEKAGQWAAYLSENYKVGKGDIVAVNLDRSVLQLVCIAGIIKTGAAYLPTDYAIPAERLRFILEDSDAKAVITGRDLNSDQAANAAVINVSDAAGSLQNYKPAYSGAERHADDTFYVMYTSGSTGKPKGVIVPDSCIINYALWFSTAHTVNNRDSSVLFSSIAFDLSYTSLWPVLISGGTLHIVEEMPVFDADYLLDLLVQEQVSYIKLTPSHFNLLINSTKFPATAMKLNLRTIVLGGEPPRVNDIEYYLQYKKDTAFVNHYGPTEATIGVVTCPINTAGTEAFRQKPFIGKPTYNNCIYIVNEQMEMVPFGVLGEICVAGRNVTNGYLKQPGLTAQKFIQDPFGNSGKLYKTGDLGRWAADGNIEFFGRKDFQVKINGYRIELNEIEQVMLGYKNITRAFVTTGKDEKSLAAFFTGSDTVSVPDLKKFLGLHLPDYMIPGTLTAVTQFPLLPNGKIDRNTLLNTSFMKPVNEDYVAPATELENHLAALWQEALETEQVSVNDNFFDIGGNSFKLVKVFREFSKKYPGLISLTDLFKYSSIRSLADYITEKQQVKETNKHNTFSFEV